MVVGIKMHLNFPRKYDSDVRYGLFSEKDVLIQRKDLHLFGWEQGFILRGKRRKMFTFRLHQRTLKHDNDRVNIKALCHIVKVKNENVECDSM